MDGCMTVRIDGWMDDYVVGRLTVCMDGWMGDNRDGWMDGWYATLLDEIYIQINE